MRLVVITGPTACGKTRLAAGIAHRLGSSVLSADSRQVYRGLDIGTGKDLDEFARFTPPVPVRLVDLADPGELYSLYRYKQDFHQVLLDEARDPAVADGSRPLVVCGGTGLYLEAILRDFRLVNVPEDVALRNTLMERDLTELVADLRREDPARLARTDLSSKKRVVRALEITRACRERPVELAPPLPRPLQFVAFALQVERRALNAMIDRRLHERLGAGLIEEVEHLVRTGTTADRLDMLGMEYREVGRFVRDEVSREAMEVRLSIAIHQLAKRQDTYLRGMVRRGIPLIPIEPGDVERVMGTIAEGRLFAPVQESTEES